MAEICPGCQKSFRNLKNHLAQSSRCPAALEFKTHPPEPEPVREQLEEAPPTSPSAGGLTAAEVGTIVAEALNNAMAQMNEAITNRLETERLATQQQFAQVGPAVLKYLREEAAKEQAQAQPATNPQEGQPQPPGSNGLSELAKILGMFIKPSGGGLEQIAETIGSIGKLADAMDSLRYQPWRAGVDFATQNILQQSRMGIEPAQAAETLQRNPPNWAKNPSKPPEGKP